MAMIKTMKKIDNQPFPTPEQFKKMERQVEIIVSTLPGEFRLKVSLS
jgi:hypothetical protein